eukprot:Seg454.5 transcript_id=Seg454.5/GoldUCD/mRNA.D3Y31 product="hypothetical protein" protein_id=Seg454.5/GoldUCD/D3Y31
MPKEKAVRPRRSATRASTVSSSNAVANVPVERDIPFEPIPAVPNAQQERSADFSPDQLIKIADIVNNAVRNNLTEVASRAARTALDLARSDLDRQPTGVPTPISNQVINVDQIATSAPLTTSFAAAATNLPPVASQSSQGAGFTPEIPAAYVRSIQMGEFLIFANFCLKTS